MSTSTLERRQTLYGAGLKFHVIRVKTHQNSARMTHHGFKITSNSLDRYCMMAVWGHPFPSNLPFPFHCHFHTASDLCARSYTQRHKFLQEMVQPVILSSGHCFSRCIIFHYNIWIFQSCSHHYTMYFSMFRYMHITDFEFTFLQRYLHLLFALAFSLSCSFFSLLFSLSINAQTV